jgi:hypothetical protein
MRQKPGTRRTASEKTIKDIRRATRKQYSAEEKIRIVLDGLRGEETIAAVKTAAITLIRLQIFMSISFHTVISLPISSTSHQQEEACQILRHILTQRLTDKR